MKNFMISLFFVIVMMLLVIGYALSIAIAADALCICYVFRWYSLVVRLADYISDCLESLNDMIYNLQEEAEEVLTKKQSNDN